MSESSNPPSSDAVIEDIRDAIDLLFGSPGIVISDTAAQPRSYRDICVQFARLGKVQRIPSDVHQRHIKALVARGLIEWIEVQKPGKEPGDLPNRTGSYWTLTELGRRAAEGEGKKDAGPAAADPAGPLGPDDAGLPVPAEPRSIP